MSSMYQAIDEESEQTQMNQTTQENKNRLGFTPSNSLRTHAKWFGLLIVGVVCMIVMTNSAMSSSSATISRQAPMMQSSGPMSEAVGEQINMEEIEMENVDFPESINVEDPDVLADGEDFAEDEELDFDEENIDEDEEFDEEDVEEEEDMEDENVEADEDVDEEDMEEIEIDEENLAEADIEDENYKRRRGCRYRRDRNKPKATSKVVTIGGVPRRVIYDARGKPVAVVSPRVKPQIVQTRFGFRKVYVDNTGRTVASVKISPKQAVREQIKQERRQQARAAALPKPRVVNDHGQRKKVYYGKDGRVVAAIPLKPRSQVIPVGNGYQRAILNNRGQTVAVVPLNAKSRILVNTRTGVINRVFYDRNGRKIATVKIGRRKALATRPARRSSSSSSIDARFAALKRKREERIARLRYERQLALQKAQRESDAAKFAELERQRRARDAARLERQRLARLERQRRAREAARLERLERQRLARLEEERRAKEAARLERLERKRLARLEAERLERQRLARLEAERLERQRLARLEEERRAKEAARIAQQQREERERREFERKEQDRKAREAAAAAAARAAAAPNADEVGEEDETQQ